MDRDEYEWQMEMTERKERLKLLGAEAQKMGAEAQRMGAEAQTKVLEAQKLMMSTYADLCPNKEIDDRARLMFKDNIMNIVSQSVVQPQSHNVMMIGNGTADDKPITISTVAAAMGKRFSAGDLQKIGKRVVAAYREKYDNKEPSKHEQMVDGGVRFVNSYKEKDRAMIEDIISKF